MTKLLFLLAFISFNSFASDLLMSKHATSGYTLPENRFVKDCKIQSNGVLQSTSQVGDGIPHTSTRKLFYGQVLEMKYLLRLASHRKIIDNGVQCDGGNRNVTGYRNGDAIMILDIKDCYSYKLRAGWAARRLRTRVTRYCGF